MAFSENVRANNNLARCPLPLPRSRRLPIFGAHDNKVADELAACWDGEMHWRPIILSVICFRC